MINSFNKKGKSLSVRPILSAAFCALFIAGIAVGHGPLALASPSTQALKEADCRFISSTAAAKPDTILLGQTSDLNIHLQADCFGKDDQPLDLILLVDNSAYAQNSIDKISRVKGLLKEFESHGLVSVGVVSFANGARTTCDITNDLDDVPRCLSSIHGTNDSRANIGAGIDRAVQMLEHHRSGGETDPMRAIAIVSDARWPCQPNSAGLIGSVDHEVMGICLDSENCNQSCMADIVGSGNVFQLTTISRAAKNLSKKRDKVENRLEDLDVGLTISNAFEINRDNVDPRPLSFIQNDHGTHVVWKMDESQAKDFQVGISQIKPNYAGSQSLGSGFSLDITDRFGRAYSKSIQAPIITVLKPGPEQEVTPTRVATEVPPTEAPPTATSSPDPTANRLPHQVYFPSVLSEDLTDLNGGGRQPHLWPHR